MFSKSYFSSFLVPFMHSRTCFLSFNLESLIRSKQETSTIIYQLTLITENHNAAVSQRESICMDETRGSNFNEKKIISTTKLNAHSENLIRVISTCSKSELLNCN